jgi:hypothetical protein
MDPGSCIAPVQHLRASLAKIGFLQVLSDLPWLPHNTPQKALPPTAGAVPTGPGLCLFCETEFSEDRLGVAR